MPNQLDQLCINTVRFLSVDAVQQANSGQPGMPLGASAMVYVLWSRWLRHNPRNPDWFDRDRFVLSARVAEGWCRYVGERGEVLGADHFGTSAPGSDVLREHGFAVDNVCRRARLLIEKIRDIPQTAGMSWKIGETI